MKPKSLIALAAFLTVPMLWAQEPIEVPEAAKNQFVEISQSKKSVKHPKLDSLLVELKDAFATNSKKTSALMKDRGLLFKDGDKVLVEIRVNQKKNADAGKDMRALGFEKRHNNVPGLYEGWVSVGRLEALAKNKNIQFIRQARRVDLSIGNSDTQGIVASSANTWLPGIDGTGVTIANIDGGYTDFALRQATNDWPTGAQVTTIDTNGGGFGNGTPHGTATVEINYDMAPGADYLIYETTTVNDWHNALDAATLAGADVVSVSLGAPLDGVGDGTDCPPGFPSPCGSIAEAATDARNAGVLVVNAAGNERESHWGGLYNPLGATGTHDWGGGGNVNFMSFCVPNGFQLVTTLHWDDWTNVNQDYDLVFLEWDWVNTTWVQVASSTNAQTGGAGQTPQEFIVYTVASALGTGNVGECGVGTGLFGILVSRTSGATNNNLQLFAPLDLDTQVAARSLGFPADSPSVMTVAAVDAGTLAQESYSSEGPVLGTGGSLAASTIDKPNIAAYANVDTEAYGAATFNGTSAATPHVAGAAALVLEEFPSYFGHPEATQQFLENCALDLGAVGWETQHGHGELELCGGTFDTWTRDNVGDVGNEPYGIGSIWHSPDIKICKSQNCPTSEQPDFGQTNYIYVTLRNTGPNGTVPNAPAVGTINTYYSNMGGAAQWPADWTFINSEEVVLAPGEVREVEIEWNNVPAVGHYCMLSRWVSVDDPMAFVEVAQTTTNVRNNNNISWKNFNVEDLLANIIGCSGFVMRNTFKEALVGQLELRFPTDADEMFIRGGGQVRIEMDPEDFRRLGKANFGKNLEVVGENVLQMVGNPAILELPFEAFDFANLQFKFEAREPFELAGKQRAFNFEAVQMREGRDIGGTAFQILARGKDTDTDGDRIPDILDEDDDNDDIKDAEDADPIDPKIGKIATKQLKLNLRNAASFAAHPELSVIRGINEKGVALALDVDPEMYERVDVQVQYDSAPTGVAVELSDDLNGFANVAVENDNLFIDGGAIAKQGASLDAGQTTLFEISADRLVTKTPGNTRIYDQGELINIANGKLFLSFNGGLNGAEGEGVSNVIITLVPKAP